MSKLESIVPSLELCRKIPAGEFEDTVFAWRYPTYDERNRRLLSKWHIIEVNWDAVKEYKKKYDERFFPAPTLDEILDELKDITEKPSVYYGKLTKTWVCDSMEYLTPIKDKKAVNATLRLWLRMKGIEVE